MKIKFRLEPYIFVPCLCSVLIALSGCDSSSNTNNASPTPTPKSKAVVVAESESDFQQQPDFENLMRAEVRQTVSETVKAKLPSWTIKGLAIEPYQNNVFWVAADIEMGHKNVVLSLVVRRFFPESGNPYWKLLMFFNFPIPAGNSLRYLHRLISSFCKLYNSHKVSGSLSMTNSDKLRYFKCINFPTLFGISVIQFVPSYKSLIDCLITNALKHANLLNNSERMLLLRDGLKRFSS